ncbi:DUF397 domain-containing protein [Amycolatopsis sp. cmx-4-68]|uniref:DUF397 domain-containing protein n=1 Tax=Amycolatopsis sp. cmx-4-68 TaxID=2790938 RepID=UPI00397C69DD
MTAPMHQQHPPGVWRKSSYSNGSNSCVEVALADAVGVRDTKDRDGGALVVRSSEWRAFVAELRD